MRSIKFNEIRSNIFEKLKLFAVSSRFNLVQGNLRFLKSRVKRLKNVCLDLLEIVFIHRQKTLILAFRRDLE